MWRKIVLLVAATWLADAQSYTITTIAGGGPITGQPATSYGLLEPYRVAVDSFGNIYVALFYWCQVWVINASGNLAQVVGNGACGYSGDGGPAASAQLYNPSGVAVDGNGNLYIADAGNQRIRKVSGGVITTVAGTGATGYNGDGISATSAELSGPRDIAVDGIGNIYVAEAGNERIRKVSGGVITTVAGAGTRGYNGDGISATSAELAEPFGVAVDSSGNLYIADTDNERIRKVSGGVITTVAGTGTRGYNGDGISATLAELNQPSGVAVDSSGNLYIADTYNQGVRKVAGETITTVPISAHFPMGVAVAGTDVYIADSGSNRVAKISGGAATTVVGNGLGYEGDGSSATRAEVYVGGVAVDGSGNIFLSDPLGCVVRKVAAGSGVISTVVGNGICGYNGEGISAASAELNGAISVAVDTAGDLYIAVNSRIQKVSNGTITTVAGTGTAGYNGDGIGATSAELNYPTGVAVDSTGNLYIADTSNNRIRKVSGGIITTVAGTGTLGYNGDSINATSAELANPTGVTIDSSGNLYIADESNERIRKVSSGIITTVAGTGTLGYNGDGISSTSAELANPTGVMVDSSGSLYISDTLNQRVRKVTAGVIDTIAGDGTPGFSGDGGIATSAEIALSLEFSPSAINLDNMGNVYLGDAINNRVRKLTRNALSMTTIALASSLNPSTFGQNVTLASTVSPSAATGTVTFNDGVTSLGTSPLNGGKATFALSALAVGAHSLTAVYSGDANYSGSTSPVLTQTVVSQTCSYAVSPTSIHPPTAGGSFTISVQTSAGCSWTVSSPPSWITVSGSSSGSGPASITLAVAVNSGVPRSAQISIAGVAVTVSQSGLLINTGGVVSDASYTAPVAPGSIAAIFGTFLLASPVSVSAFPVPSTLGGLSFQFSSAPSAPLFYANLGQANIQVPWELVGQSQATVTATINGQNSAPQTVNIAPYAPAIFAVDGGGTGQGAILDSKYHLVDETNPATAGSAVVQIYCTGLGPVTNQPITGASSPSSPLAQTTAQPAVTIGGVSATVLFSGLTPGDVGLYQVDAMVPSGTTSGNEVPVMITIGGVQSNIVTIAVQ